jgi:uncharacterized protein YbaP (TraB family)
MRVLAPFLSLFILLVAKAQPNEQHDVFNFPMDVQALLWKIEDRNADTPPSYLFGTMHLIEREHFYFPEKLKNHLISCQQLIMEIAGAPDQKDVMKYLQLNEGSFFDVFTHEQEDSILNWGKNELGLSPSQFRGLISKMKPFYVVQMATQLLFSGNMESYEMTLEKLAIDNHIELKGLESIDEQTRLLDGLSISAQTEMVMEVIRNPHQNYAEMKNLEQSYLRQQIDSLYLHVVNSEGTISSSFNTRFIDDRNTKWVPIIEQSIQEKPSFIAVGAGHLGGPNGLIRLLQRRGYQLTPVAL